MAGPDAVFGRGHEAAMALSLANNMFDLLMIAAALLITRAAVPSSVSGDHAHLGQSQNLKQGTGYTESAVVEIGYRDFKDAHAFPVELKIWKDDRRRRKGRQTNPPGGDLSRSSVLCHDMLLLPLNLFPQASACACHPCSGTCVPRGAETVAALSERLSSRTNLTRLAEAAHLKRQDLVPSGTHELQLKAHCECVELPAHPLAFKSTAQFETFCQFAYSALRATGLCINGWAFRSTWGELRAVRCAGGDDVRLAARGVAVTGRSSTRTRVWSTSLGNVTRYEKFDDMIDEHVPCWPVSKKVRCIPLSSASVLELGLVAPDALASSMRLRRAVAADHGMLVLDGYASGVEAPTRAQEWTRTRFSGEAPLTLGDAQWLLEEYLEYALQLRERPISMAIDESAAGVNAEGDALWCPYPATPAAYAATPATFERAATIAATTPAATTPITTESAAAESVVSDEQRVYAQLAARLTSAHDLGLTSWLSEKDWQYLAPQWLPYPNCTTGTTWRAPTVPLSLDALLRPPLCSTLTVLCLPLAHIW